ncbi:MAG TPA: hypothetical protein VJN93_17155 [Candidatus Acidoferrum sp.]|nr:hypothetical protein [Candidatus Acidoferrum sp.]
MRTILFRSFLIFLAAIFLGFASGGIAFAQTPSQDIVPPPTPPLSNTPPLSPDQLAKPQQFHGRPADGKRHGMPLESYGVAPGTKFLVALEDELASKSTAERARFRVRTLQPLQAGDDIYLPSGAFIEGHVSHVEPAGATGRARMWLTFDEIETAFGRLPIVAEVVSVPGEHSVRTQPGKEGLIEGRASTQQDAAEAAAAGAAMGALQGVKDKDKKEAAEGAALGALTAYLIETGRGHELNLPKGVKLELKLERPLYLVKE